MSGPGDGTGPPAGAVPRIIGAYDDLVVRLYCRGRFHVLRQCFLTEIGQYLPATGKVLDVGCGFGLFSLYYAHWHPALRLLGVDRNPRRIALARRAGERLGLTGVRYEVGDALDFAFEPGWDAVYMLDLVHHVPESTVRPLLARIFEALRPGARLLLKDVDTSPAYKRWFTWILDALMDPRTPPHYWSRDALRKALVEVGFRTYAHSMVDYLPYPHVLYVCERP